jgi:hypothetical protein
MALTKTGKLQGTPTGTEETPLGQGGDKQRSIRRQNEAAKAVAYAGYRVENSPTVKSSDNLADLKDNPDYRIEGLIFDCYAPITLLPDNPSIWYHSLSASKQNGVGAQMKQIMSLFTLARMEQQENGEFDEFDDDISDTSVWDKYLKARMAYALSGIQTQVREKVTSGQTRNIVLNLVDSICEAANIKHLFDTNKITNLKYVIVLKPKSGAQPEDSYPVKDGSYEIYPPKDFVVTEYEFS